jgi:hypothetical protein
VAVTAGYPSNEKSVIPHLDNFAAKLNDPGWGDDNMKAVMLHLMMKIADHSPAVSDTVYEPMALLLADNVVQDEVVDTGPLLEIFLSYQWVHRTRCGCYDNTWRWPGTGAGWTWVRWEAETSCLLKLIRACV